MAFQYRYPDGKVDPKRLRACRKQVLADADMSAADKAGWLSRFDHIEASRDSAHPGRLVSMSAQNGGVTIDMFGDIGEGFFSEGITAQSVARQIDGVKGTIQIRMNSAGGSAMEGNAIASLLTASPATVEVDILGLAASAASIIAMSGDQVTMADNALMMIHEATARTFGGVREHQSTLQLLEAVNQTAAETYSRRSGKKTVDEMRTLMAAQTGFTAAQAIEVGLADSTTAAQPISQQWDPEELPAPVQALLQGHLQPTARDIDLDMSIFALRLGLAESATEAEVLAALDAQLAERKTVKESDAEADKAVKAVADESIKDVQAAAVQLHEAACSAAVERFMAEGKIPPATREAAIKACGSSAETLSAACKLWEQYPALVTRAAVPSKLPAAKATTLTPQQKKLAAMAKLTDEQFLAAQNGDR